LPLCGCVVLFKILSESSMVYAPSHMPRACGAPQALSLTARAAYVRVLRTSKWEARFD
jgi:hypothetical protein